MAHLVRLSSSALLAVAPLAAQNWIETVPATTPGIPVTRSWSTLCPEPGRSTLLLFGGFDGTTASVPQSLGDAWRYDPVANTFTAVTAQPQPAARDSHVMALDPVRNQAVLFGGWDTNFRNHADTWTWNGTAWTLQAPPSSPPPRGNAAMVYHPGRRTCILVGGTDQIANVTYQDTWEWNGSTWTQLFPATPPPPRIGHSLAYDASRNRVVLFGGADATWSPQGDTYEFDGSTWTLVATPTAPPARVFGAMVYDQGRGCCVLFGGMDHGYQDLGDTWEWRGSWSQRGTVNAPAPRDSMAMAYDPGQGCVVLFGGFDGFLDRGDTWEFTPAAFATYSTFGAGCAGSGGVPTLQPWNAPALGATFRLSVRNLPPAGGVVYLGIGFSDTVWNGQPLPLSLAGLGLPGCTAYCSLPGGTTLVHGGPVADWSLLVPAQPALAGTRFFNQAVSLDPAAGNPAGAAVSDAGRGVIR